MQKVKRPRPEISIAGLARKIRRRAKRVWDALTGP